MSLDRELLGITSKNHKLRKNEKDLSFKKKPVFQAADYRHHQNL
jgi:hypothetical protein